MNYFSLLAIPESFEIDLAALEAAYFKAQRAYHPDRFVGKSAPEKMAALQTSADINHAYETLKNPLKRAQYLLHLQGITVGTEKDSVKPSQAILIEVMNLREEEASAETLAILIDASLNLVARYLREGVYAEAAQETIRLGYLQKILHDTKANK